MLKTAGSLNEKQTLFAERITNGLEHVTELIDNLFDLSKIEVGLETEETRVDIGQLARQVVADFQEQAEGKRQHLVCHAPGEPAPVLGNALRLRQVISHLIDNALRYTPEKGHISTIVRVEDKHIMVKVEDNGLGIPPKDLPFVFDKFFRVKNGAQPEIRGAGLGLAICKSVIEKYKGHIWVESQLNQGSAFIFTLPLALAEESNEASDITYVTAAKLSA
jgi:signal transduction histidine kinase